MVPATPTPSLRLIILLLQLALNNKGHSLASPLLLVKGLVTSPVSLLFTETFETMEQNETPAVSRSKTPLPSPLMATTAFTTKTTAVFIFTAGMANSHEFARFLFKGKGCGTESRRDPKGNKMIWVVMFVFKISFEFLLFSPKLPTPVYKWEPYLCLILL